MGHTAWSSSTAPPAQIKQCSPRYLFSNLLFQSRRENYRPLITQGEEHTAPILVISSTTIKHFRKRAWKPEIVGQGSFRLVPSLITHKRNKNEGSSLLLPLASKSVCPIWDQELGLLGMKMLSLRKDHVLFPGWQFRAVMDFKAGWSGWVSRVWPAKYHERVSPLIPTLSLVLTLELWKAQSPPQTPILETSSFDKDFETCNSCARNWGHFFLGVSPREGCIISTQTCTTSNAGEKPWNSPSPHPPSPQSLYFAPVTLCLGWAPHEMRLGQNLFIRE